MGLLDNVVKTTYIDGIVDIKTIYEVLEKKLGNKYEVKFIPRQNFGKQLIGAGTNIDQIFIAKNAYHRTFISINQKAGVENEETHLAFDRDTLKWYLILLNKSFGIIGVGLLRLIYGSNKPFDDDILDALNSKYEIKSREESHGLSQLWKSTN